MRTIMVVMIMLQVLFLFSTARAEKKVEPEACGPENTHQSFVRNGTFLFSYRDTDAVSSGVVYQIISLQPDGFETIVIHSHPDNNEDPDENVAFAIFEWSCDKKGVRPEDEEQCVHFWQYHSDMDEDFRAAYVYTVKSHEVVPGVLKGKLQAIDVRVVTRWVRKNKNENIYANRAFIRNQITGKFDLVHERRFYNRNHCIVDQDDPREGAHERIEFFTSTFPRFHAAGFMNMFTVKINKNRERIVFYSYNDGLYHAKNPWNYPYRIFGGDTPADFLISFDEKVGKTDDTSPGHGTWVGLSRERAFPLKPDATWIFRAQDMIADETEAPLDTKPSVVRWVEERAKFGVTELPEDVQEALTE